MPGKILGRALDPEYADAHYNLAIAYYRLMDMAMARHHYEAARRYGFARDAGVLESLVESD